MELVENDPLDVAKIGQLISGKDDLFLVWPDAKFPFDSQEWERLFREDIRNKSFFAYENGVLIGHAALFAKSESSVYGVAFMFISETYRSRGAGEEMLRLLEELAVNQLHATKLVLQVRDYNPRAITCYMKRGFQEYQREGTLILMEKLL